MVIKLFLPILKKLKFGQNIRLEGPKSHYKKSGTPTMGGVIIIIVTLSGYYFAKLLFGDYFIHYQLIDDLVILFPFIAYGIIGLIDDLLTIKKHTNEGLTVKQKFILEIVFAGIYYFIYLTLHFNNNLNFFGANLELGFVYGILVLLLLTASTNATNFTDGIDGLLGTTAITSFLCLGIYSYIIGKYNIMFIAISVIIAILGFLVFNFNSAKLFMGDTGSLALGGLLVSCLIYLKIELLIIFFGFIYFVEIISVILQVWFFKRTKGQRIFKMTPLHHHFELLGCNEYEIDLLFSLTNLLFSVIGILLGVSIYN